MRAGWSGCRGCRAIGCGCVTMMVVGLAGVGFAEGTAGAMVRTGAGEGDCVCPKIWACCADADDAEAESTGVGRCSGRFCVEVPDCDE